MTRQLFVQLQMDADKDRWTRISRIGAD